MKILVDTSIWVDHLNHGDERLVNLLNEMAVLGHPFVLGELALGNLRRREIVLESLAALPQSLVASDEEVLQMIARHHLHGLGIGYVAAHLLAATLLTEGARLWTRDKRLRAVAQRFDLGLEWD